MNDITYYKEIDIMITDISLVTEQTRVKEKISKRKSGRPLHGFIYVIEGRVHYFFNSSDFYVNKGDLLHLTKGSIYSFDIESEFYHYAYVDFDFVQNENISMKDAAYRVKNTNIMENLFIRLNKEWFHKYPAYRLNCKAILYEIISLLFQNQAAFYIPGIKNERFKAAISYLENNFTDKKLNIARLAEMAGMSEVHFRRLFKNTYHVLPVKYLNILRTGRAKDLLKQTMYSITDIAEMTGYSDVYYFSKAFKKMTGTSPSEYNTLYDKGCGIIK